ncbi:MAG TPA: zinc-ribbon domain-containing protein [Candidatus Acidoferrales bacterium]|nr:zinc-ribbon domain-containing protein [Candidatus Acidoferrales bacterium]
MFCHSCGTQVNTGVQFCPNCGQSLAGPAPAVPADVPFVARTGITATPGRWIGAGWEVVKADLGNIVLVALVFVLLNGVPLIQGALVAGFHFYFLKKLMGRNPEFADLFKGFNFFIPTLVASLLIGLFVFLGTLLCIIPGLVVAAMYKFTYLFIIDKRMDFWPAMQASHAVTRNDYFGFTMFLLLTALVNLLGFLCCIVGLLVTIPLTFAAITIAYQELVGFDPQTPERIA